MDGLTDANVTVGAVTSYVTELSVDVALEFAFPKTSTTVFAAIVGIIVPAPVMAVAARFQVILSPVLRLQVTPVAVPVWTISLVMKLDEPTAPENTTVKFTGSALIGSTCVAD